MSKAQLSDDTGLADEMKKSSKTTGDIESLTIKPSTNGGYTVECRMAPKKSDSSKDGGCSPYVEPDTLVFGNTNDLLSYLSDTF